MPTKALTRLSVSVARSISCAATGAHLSANLSRYYAGMMQDGLRIAGTLWGGGEKDILMRVSASSTGLQVRAGVLSELKRRCARKKLQRLCYLGKDLKDDDVVGAVQLNACPMGYAHTVVYMCLAKDTGDEAAATQADAIFARVAAKFRAEMAQLLSLSQEVAVA